VRALALFVAVLVASPAIAQTPFSFAAFGDTPYFEFDVPGVQRLLDDMAEQRVAFAVHIGDLKSGTSHCDDDTLLARRALLDGSAVPLIYTPGDNEWTDCNRPAAGGFASLERLDRLRALFFATDESLGKSKLRLLRQSEQPRFRAYRENARWVMGHVVFATLNVPGSNNNLRRNERTNTEHAARMAANFAWLDEAIEAARAEEMLGLVIFAHADPLFRGGQERNDGYATYRAALRTHALAFPKPMLLVHGDGHRYRVDQPLRDPRTGERFAHFTRVEVFGAPTVNWVRIDVTPAGERLFAVTRGSNPFTP
jgi:hypothetical protein